MTHPMPVRTIALVLALVLLVVAGTPAKAEAVDALALVAIGTLVVAGILIIAYLVIANVEGNKRADEGRVIWIAQSSAGLGGVVAERGNHGPVEVVQIEGFAHVVEASAP